MFFADTSLTWQQAQCSSGFQRVKYVQDTSLVTSLSSLNLDLKKIVSCSWSLFRFPYALVTLLVRFGYAFLTLVLVKLLLSFG